MKQRALVAEFLGTFMLMSSVLGAAFYSFAAPAGAAGILGVALSIGFTVMALAFSIGHISGGHFNPAVTLGLVAGGRVDANCAIGYIIAQCSGALAACAFFSVIGNAPPTFAAMTLFASGQSITSAKLVPCCAQPLRLNPAVRDIVPYYMVGLDKVRRKAGQFDILHFHIDQFHFPIFHATAHRTVTTLHGRQDLPDLHHLYRGFPDMPLVSISNAQRAPIPGANFIGTVHHGLPRDFTLTADPHGGYLAFLGRISPEKRVDRAIAIARAAGLPSKIAAKVDRVDEVYFRSEIEPLLKQPGIEYLGEIDDRRKIKFLGEARALLFPIDWPEPFGLAMIEAMACGTPVLAFRNGAVPEVIDDGVTGYVVDSVDEAIGALGLSWRSTAIACAAGSKSGSPSPAWPKTI